MEISLQACRINANLTQSEFAKALGVSPATIYNWEAGKTEPNISQLRAISELSGIPFDYIAVGKKAPVLSSGS